ncbi:MAG: sigma-70 family RNA polymerase sigma factor [Planctomycetota bacterium]|nr:MAG: sigma-70 family RNA polymerase sigma factor [Planctomycetota bacterium]
MRSLLRKTRGLDSVDGGMNPSERIELVQAVTRHQSMIQAYAYAIVRDFHAAEDIFQEVAIIVAEHWESVPAGDGLIPWLRETTRRKALEALRKQRRSSIVLSDSVFEKLADSFKPGGPGPDLKEALASCLSRLEGPSRAILEARCGQGLAGDVIAQRLGRTIQSVYSILKRARVILAQCVEKKLAGGVS